MFNAKQIWHHFNILSLECTKCMLVSWSVSQLVIVIDVDIQYTLGIGTCNGNVHAHT